MTILQAGTAELRKLESIQAQRAATLKEIRDIERAPLALEELRARVRRVVEQVAKEDWAISGLRGFGWPDGAGDIPTLNDGGVSPGLLIALIGVDAAAERIVAIATADKAVRGLPLEKRAAKVKELRANVR